MAILASTPGNSAHVSHDFGFAAVLAIGKRILNGLSEVSAAASDRSRFAALPRRYLDDVDMTVGERVAALHYEEPVFGTWQAIAAH